MSKDASPHVCHPLQYVLVPVVLGGRRPFVEKGFSTLTANCWISSRSWRRNQTVTKVGRRAERETDRLPCG